MQILLLIGLLLFGCSSHDQSGQHDSGPYLVSKKNGSVVLYAIDGVRGDVVTGYIPSVDRFATIDLQTGRYTYSGEILAYSSANCTGTPGIITNNPAAVSSKSVFFDVGQGKYYLVGARASSGSFSYNSFLSSGSCTASSGSFAASGQYTAISEISRPYDYESIAPLTLEAP